LARRKKGITGLPQDGSKKGDCGGKALTLLSIVAEESGIYKPRRKGTQAKTVEKRKKLVQQTRIKGEGAGRELNFLVINQGLPSRKLKDAKKD